MIDLKRFTQLKEQVESLQRKKDRGEGVLTQLLSQLKKDFGCKNLEAGKELLKELQQEEKQLETDFNKALAKFEKDYGERLEEE